MDEKYLDRLLNQWEIFVTPERWSLKRMYKSENPNWTEEGDFANFLEKEVGESPKDRHPPS